jgi:hypothetical protein
MQFRTSTVLAIALVTGATGALGGCAGSTASRATHDANRNLTLGQINSKAANLVADIVSKPRFVAFKKKVEAEQRTKSDIVVMLMELDKERANTDFSETELYLALEEQLADNGVSFQQSLDPGGLNYVSRVGDVDKQDSDARYDQSTGTVTTGAANKSVLFMRITVEKQDVAGHIEFQLRAKLVDSATKLTLLTASSLTENPGQERKR